MTANALKRISDLWPSLSDDARAHLADIAEGIASTPKDLRLADAERAAVERSCEDFKLGRVLSEEEFRREMDEFMRMLPRST